MSHQDPAIPRCSSPVCRATHPKSEPLGEAMFAKSQRVVLKVLQVLRPPPVQATDQIPSEISACLSLGEYSLIT